MFVFSRLSASTVDTAIYELNSNQPGAYFLIRYVLLEC